MIIYILKIVIFLNIYIKNIKHIYLEIIKDTGMKKLHIK